jgi:hypothetical protein
MNFKRCLFLASTALLMSFSAHAAQDPIGWSMSGSIPQTTQMNESYSVNFTLVNNLPFTMPTPLRISDNSTPANAVVMHDTCSGQRLARRATCSVGRTTS